MEMREKNNSAFRPESQTQLSRSYSHITKKASRTQRSAAHKQKVQPLLPCSFLMASDSGSDLMFVDMTFYMLADGLFMGPRGQITAVYKNSDISVSSVKKHTSVSHAGVEHEDVLCPAWQAT